MDYLKYLSVCTVSIVLIGVTVYSGLIFFGFVVIGCTVGYMLTKKLPVHAFSYVIWLGLFLFIYSIFQQGAAEVVAQDPQKYTPDDIALARGVITLVSLILLHPMSYGVGRLSAWLWNKTVKLPEAQTGHLIKQAWWAAFYPGEYWSVEERWLRKTVYLVLIPVACGLIYLQASILDSFGFEKHWGALLSACTASIGGLWISRRVCGWLWPDRVRRADENAARRLGEQATQS